MRGGVRDQGWHRVIVRLGRTLETGLASDCMRVSFEFLSGIAYLLKHKLVADDAEEIARFFNGTSRIHKHQKKLYLEKRHDVLRQLVQLQDFNGTIYDDSHVGLLYMHIN